MNYKSFLTKVFKLSLICILISSCAKSGKQADTKLTFNAASIVSGSVSLAGGAILVGESIEGDYFSIGVNNPNAPLNIDVPFGTWSFHVMGWDDASADSVRTMKGKLLCGRAENFVIDGPSASLTLNMSPANCGNDSTNTVFAGIDDFHPSPASVFNIKSLTIENCLYDLDSSCETFPYQIGVSSSFKVGYLGYSSMDGPLPALFSECISNSNLSVSTHPTSLTIPVRGNDSIFPLVIKAYENSSCEEDEDKAVILNLYANHAGSNPTFLNPETVMPVGASNYVRFVDNYVGKQSLIFANEAPKIHCGASSFQSCINNTQGPLPHSLFSNIRNQVFELTGAPDLKNPHDQGRFASKNFFYDEDGTPENGDEVFIEFRAKNAGGAGNTLQVRFEPSASITPEIEINYTRGSPLLIFYRSGAMPDSSDLITAFNNETGSNSELALDIELNVQGNQTTQIHNFLTTIDNINHSFSGGEEARDDGRFLGRIGRIHQDIAGIFSSIISLNESTMFTCNDVQNAVDIGQLSYDHVVSDHQVTLILKDKDTATTGGGIIAEFVHNGQLESIHQITCGSQSGFYKSFEDEIDETSGNPREHYEEMYYSNNRIELYSAHNESNRSGASISVFHIYQAPGDFYLWSSNIGNDDNGSHADRLAVKNVTGQISAWRFDGNDTSTTTVGSTAPTNATAPNGENGCFLHDGTMGSCGFDPAEYPTLMKEKSAAIFYNFSIDDVNLLKADLEDD